MGYDIPEYIHIRARNGDIVFGIPNGILGSLEAAVDTTIIEEFDPDKVTYGDKFIKYNGQPNIHERGPLVVETSLLVTENGGRHIKLGKYQEAMHEILQNLPNRLAAFTMRLVIFPLGQRFNKPSDELEIQVANLVTSNTDTRKRLIAGIYDTAGR